MILLGSLLSSVYSARDLYSGLWKLGKFLALWDLWESSIPVIFPSLDFLNYTILIQGTSLVAHMVKNPSAMQETRVQSLGGEDSWRREWLPTPVFSPGEFHGQSILAGYSPWGRKESDTTERPTLSLPTYAERVRYWWELICQLLELFFCIDSFSSFLCILFLSICLGSPKPWFLSS